MADWNNPTVNSVYTDFITQVKDRDLDVAKGLDPAVVTVTNPSTDMIRWSSANNKWQKYNGSTWVDLTTTYAISISGSAGSVAFANVTGKPTTLSGYGITDAQPLDADLTALAGLSSTGLVARTAAGTAATRSIAAPAAGITVSNADGVSGNPTLALANDLLALENLASTGIAVRSGTSTWVQRSIAQPAAGITVANADGVSANPTLALANDLAALEGLASTGIAVRTATDTWAQRTITGTTNRITVTNGSGAGGNPTLDVGTDVVTLTGAQTLTNKTISGATLSGTLSGGTFSGSTHTNPDHTVQTLTDGVTINWDMNSGGIATVTLAGNRTMAAPTNLKKGVYVLHVIQDATGSRTITWNSVFKWSGGTAPTLTTTASRRDILTFVCDGTNLYGSALLDVR